jgi:hypothetical protein
MQSGQETAMASTTAARQTSASSVSSDLSALKIRQQAASGNYAVVGTTLQIVGEQLCETLDLRAGARVLDVAVGAERIPRGRDHQTVTPTQSFSNQECLQ